MVGSALSPPAGSPLLTRLTALALRRARLILLATLALAATAALLGAGVAKHLDPYEAAGADTPSATAAHTIEHATGLELGAGMLVLVNTPTGVYTPAGRSRVRQIEQTVKADPEVA